MLVETIDFQQKIKHVNKGIFDQYQIAHTYISIVNKTLQRLWTTSFQHVGLDPFNWPSWDYCIKKTKPFIQGDALYKKEEETYVNTKYAILPPYFYGVNIEDKMLLM